MILKRLLLICLCTFVLAGCANMQLTLRYPGVASTTFRVPVSLPDNYSEAGIASYYAHKHQGRLTANVERFNMYEMTAALKSLPFDTQVRVFNVNNGRSVLVRINDRGPFIEGRIIDLSYSAFAHIADHEQGLADVVLEIL